MQEGFGDVGGGDEADAGEVDDDTLLAGNACHTAFDAPEGTVGDADTLAAAEMALRRGDVQQVFAAAAGGEDEVLHLAQRDGQRRVVLTLPFEMVKVEGNEGYGGGTFNVGLGLGRGGVDKQQVGDQRLEHLAGLAVDGLEDLPFGDVGVGAVLDEVVGRTILTPVGGTEDKPTLVRSRHIPHRHPCL